MNEWFGLEDLSVLSGVLQLESFRMTEEHEVPIWVLFPYYQKVLAKGHRIEDSNWLFSIY